MNDTREQRKYEFTIGVAWVWLNPDHVTYRLIESLSDTSFTPYSPFYTLDLFINGRSQPMTIKFACPQCGNRFALEDRFSGKIGRCNKCNRRFKIPARKAKAAAVAASGMYRLPNISSKQASRKRQKAGLDVPSNVGLAPVSHRSLERVAKIDREFLQEDKPGPYKVSNEETPWERRKRRKRKSSKPPSALKEFYWARMHGLLKFLKGLSDFGYLLSIPFITMILIAVILGSREWAVTGATGVVLINVVRFYLNLFNLAVLPFRESLSQGIMFLIPPLTLIYLFKRWKKMKRGAKRLVGPTIQIAGVFLAFIFIPVLSSGSLGEGASIRERINAESESLKKDISSEAKKAGDETVKGARRLGNEVGKELEKSGVTVENITESVREGAEAVKKVAKEKLGSEKADEVESTTDQPDKQDLP